MAKSPVTTCTSHCGACHRHFHSLSAFDAHLEHDENGWPRCLSPVDLESGRNRLLALTEHGECRVYADVERDVTIWTHAGDYERLMARLHESAPESLVEAA